MQYMKRDLESYFSAVGLYVIFPQLTLLFVTYQYYTLRENYQQDWSVCLRSVGLFHCGVLLLCLLNKTSVDGNCCLEHCVPPTWEKDLPVNIVVQLSETIKECCMAGLYIVHKGAT